MIKGVNKRVIEINSINNEYFEKAVLYVRPGSIELPKKLLDDEANSYINSLMGSSKFKRTMTPSEIAGISSAVTALVTILIFILFTVA